MNDWTERQIDIREGYIQDIEIYMKAKSKEIAAEVRALKANPHFDEEYFFAVFHDEVFNSYIAELKNEIEQLQRGSV
jgi:hypothetical protein